MKHEPRFVWLDLFRGLSALAVCAGHLRAALFVDYQDTLITNMFQKTFYFVTGLGHQAVLIFFVLSGFFVGGSVLRNRRDFKWIDYSLARLSRLWAVLIPALVLTFVIDHFIETRSPEVLSGAYYAMWNSGPSTDGAYSNSVATLLGNLFFLQTIVTPIYGTNAPLWSLANEFWYYFLFPLAVFAAGNYSAGKKSKLHARLVYGVLAVSIFFLLPPGLQTGFFIWLSGVLVYMAMCRFNHNNLGLVMVGGGAFAGALIYSKSTNLQALLYVGSDWIVGFGFAAFCYAIVSMQPTRILADRLTAVAQGLSEISYSLYLVHFPCVILISVWFYGSSQLDPNLNGFMHYFAWLVALLLVSLVFWWLFERQTNRVRKIVASIIKCHAESREPKQTST